MGRLTATMFVSLDGVAQAPGAPDEDRQGGFDLGGWLAPYVDESMNEQIAEWFSRADAFLLGRRTYEIFAAYWPRVTDPAHPIAGPLNTLPKYVASRTLDRAEWANTTLIADDLPARVADLKQRTARELQVHGSGDLLRTLTAHDLVDEYRLWICPVLLGRGRRLFPEGAAPKALRLIDTATTDTGVAVHTYLPAGRVRTGEVGAEEA